ncbi:MAG: hypothetical protein VX899_04520 [Myxococcota bacterium]|nr:hypothetical protein [Myxococcota bacterium]
MLLWICGFTAAIAGPLDPVTPSSAGEVTLSLTGSLRSFEQVSSAHHDPQVLPASWGVAVLALDAQAGLREHLAVAAGLSWWDATPKVLDAGTCADWAACEAVKAPGDLTLSLRSLWRLGAWRVEGRAGVVSGALYQRHLESLGAPGNGNLDLHAGGALSRQGTLGPLSWRTQVAAGGSLAPGRPPNTLEASAQLSVGTPVLQLGLGWMTHQSVHGVDFDVAVADPSDPARFTDLDHDLQRLDVALGVAVGPPGWWLVAGGWMHTQVDNGPADLRGAELGVQWQRD